ncbi:MAG: DUF2275 domain-containing protein [Geobacter sp.]|nr:DUF2275 domain-containing protein [Geobacter sp.]
MEHTEIRRKLSAYLDNAVNATEKARIEAHLAQCDNCRRALGDLEQTVGHLKSIPEVEPPPWLTARIMAHVRDAAAPKPSLWRRFFMPLHLKLPAEALAIVFVCVTGYYIARISTPQAPIITSLPATRQEAQLPAEPAQRQPSTEAPSKSLPSAPHAAPVLPAKNEARPYAPPPPPKSPDRPPMPAASAPASAPTAPEAYIHGGGEWVEAEREMEWGGRRNMPDAARALPGSGSSGESWSYRSERETWEDRAARKYQAEPPTQVEVSLRVNDPAGAVGTIEDAATRSGGRIVRRSYGEASHYLVVQVGAQNLPDLFARLERLGRLQKPLPGAAPEEGIVELSIRW